MVTGLRVGRSGFWISAEANDVSFLQNVQTGYGARLYPYSVGSGGVWRSNSYLATSPRIFRAVTQLSLHAFMECVGKTAFAVIRRAFKREPVVQRWRFLKKSAEISVTSISNVNYIGIIKKLNFEDKMYSIFYKPNFVDIFSACSAGLIDQFKLDVAMEWKWMWES